MSSSGPTSFSSKLVSGSQSYELLRAILDTARESIIIVDSSMQIVFSNTCARESFAHGTADLNGRRLSEVIRDASLHEAFRNAATNFTNADLKLELVGTERRAFDIRISPVTVEDTRCAIGVFYEITKIERLERIRQEFLSNISHELRTPLTSIMAFVETLEDGAIDDKENNRRFLGVIRRNSERMHALIADILELSMIESGNVSIDVRQVNIGHMVDEVFASLSSKAAEKEVALKNLVPVGTRVMADPGRLEQMLTNLVDNAIKFNRPNGSVTLSLESDDHFQKISVEDTGEGIVPEHADRIFERLYRVDRGRTRDIGGTGLGLAIVKHLTRLHGGEISVSSQLGVGTRFVIELPLKPNV
jgi:two-component system, OmpR family, phosphate regulon sensor histidine kinase PhoR